MGASSFLYNNVLKRTSTYTLAVVMGAFFFERTFDMVTENIFDNYNKGKLWKHIKSNYGE